MSEIERISLGDLCDIVIGRTPKREDLDNFGGNHVWVSIADMNGKFIEDSKEKLTDKGLNESKSRLIPQGTLLLSFKLSLGKVAITKRPLYTNEAIAALIPKKNVNVAYLYYYLKQVDFSKHARNAVKGLCLNKEILSKVEVSLVPIESQSKIVSILEKIERLKEWRNQSDKLTQDFFMKMFLELFGNPLKNTKNWNFKKLEEIATVERGRFSPRPRNDPIYFEGNYPFIQTGDIAESGGIISTWSQTLNEKGKKVSKCFKIGTIVIAIVGATIGETAILSKEVYAPDSVVGISVDSKKANNFFVEYLLRFWKPVFRAIAPHTARANINLGIIKPLVIPLPPLDLQNKFGNLIIEYRRIREKQVFSFKEINNFEKILQKKVFEEK